LKKPHALIGLLAAVGTALGVLIAVVGMPYGRFGGTAFADLYHAPANHPTVHFAIDCDTVTPGFQDYCIRSTTPGPFDVAVELHNNSGGPAEVTAFDFQIQSPDTTKVNALADGGPAGNLDSNPDATQANLTPGVWSCNPPAPQADNDGNAGNGVDVSFLSCFDSTGSGPTIPDGGSLQMALIHYEVPMGATPGIVPLTFVILGGAGDPLGIPWVACPGPDCIGSTIELQPPPPEPTDTPTNTPTAVPTATPVPPDPAVVKFPETCLDPNSPNCDVDVPASNLFLCEVGPCDGPGEGNLIVFEYARNILTGDQNGDTFNDGLGAYEFSVEYDNFVIASVNPSDVVFAPSGSVNPYPGGWDGVLDGEGAARAPSTCDFSIVTENIVHFGCVTSGPLPAGPEGDMDLARLNLIPHEDLANDLFPGNDNGVVTVIKDNGCELVDVFGHPVASSVNGGLTPICGNLAITVRILEGDLNLDCVVDVEDQQLIAFRYSSFFGSTLYSQWYDLEPALHDLDIDIKDIQKVFGRDGSTCENPIPAQPPLAPPVPF
jgi:hypothetical protein